MSVTCDCFTGNKSTVAVPILQKARQINVLFPLTISVENGS